MRQTTAPERRRFRVTAAVTLLVLGGVIAACGGGGRSAACQAYDTLRQAVREMNAARAEGADLGRQVDEVDRLLRVARSQLSTAQADQRTAAAARVMLEGAGYLAFMVESYRTSGTVDFSYPQFTSRELTRAISGAGGPPLNC